MLLSNATSTSVVAARAAANTALSASSGSLSAVLTNMWLHHFEHDEISFSLEACMNGALAGAVAITGVSLCLQMRAVATTR